MKRKLLKALSIITAFLTAIPIANAAASDYTIGTPSQAWVQAGSNPSGYTPFDNNYLQGAATDEVIYTLPTASKEDYMVGTYYTAGKIFGQNRFEQWSAGGTQGFAYDNTSSWITSTARYCYAGSAIATDDAGTLYTKSVKSGNGPTGGRWADPIGGITYWTERPTAGATGTKAGVSLGYTILRSDLMSANGDGIKDTGYLWFTPNTTTTISRITITKGSFSSSPTNFNAPIENGSRAYVKEYSKGKLLYNPSLVSSSGKLYRGTYTEGSTTVSWEDLGLTVHRHGSSAFVLGQHEIIAYSKSTTQIALYDYTTKQELATFTPFSTASGQTYVSHSIDVKVNGNTANIYIFVPGQGGAKYTMTATPITAAVNGVDAALTGDMTNSVKVTWGVPSKGTATKYAVCYSSDGGSSWSTEVETKSLSYTFDNLPTGSYTFKVTAYFGGNSTWGQATTSQPVNVIAAKGTPVTGLTATYILNDDASKEYCGRQDIQLAWDAPTGYTNTEVTGYKIYRGESLLTTVDANTLTYVDMGVKENYTYKVVPLFTDLTEDSTLGMEVTTTEVTTVLVAPVITETRSYDGYSITQLFFSMPTYSQVKPLSFNVYRNGVLLESGITALNYIDDDLPKINENKTYNYTIEAVYSATYDNATRTSAPKAVDVTPRDWALSGFLLQELYNVPITQNAIGNWQNLLDNNEYYRQGQFHDGHWYLAQTADNLSKADQGISGGGNLSSGIEGSTGGVIAIKASEEIDVRNGVVQVGGSSKVITTEEFANVGIAMDDAGTIFVRSNNLELLGNSQPTGLTLPTGTWFVDAYERRISQGTLYKRNSDGTYTESKTIDLTPLWTDDRWIDNMYYSGIESYGQAIGRSDYYHMYGDVWNGEGYLLLSPSWTRTGFKVKIENGAYDSHEVIEFHDYTDNGVTHKVATGTENYGFKIAGRDAWMMQIRSNAYFGIHGVEEQHQGEEHDHEWHAIYDTDSRVNNSGGTSIVAFDNPATEINDGETFLITPASMYSLNSGDFIVTRGIKENIGDAASESKLAPPMPVAQYKQTEVNTNVATFANGNWFHAETGTYESASGENSECVYIYQYVPGVRFAKYRLYPDLNYPMVIPELKIETAYNDDMTDITHFKGTATWTRPEGFGRTDASNANVKVESYTFEFLDAKGNLIHSEDIPEQYDDEGNPPSDDFVYCFDYCLNDEIISQGKDKSLDFQTYTARVAVNYVFENGSTHQSAFNLAIDDNDYFAESAEDTYVKVFELKNYTSYDEDGNASQNDAYRVEIDFNPPSWEGYEDGQSEPVSYYTIKAVVNRNTTNDTIDIKDFALHNGSYAQDGKLWATTEVTSQIPGTYDFSKSKAPYYTSITDAANGTGRYNGSVDGGSFRDVVLSWFHIVPAGTYNSGVAVASNGDEVVITDSPDQWQFIIVAHYAANNRYIAKERATDATTEPGLIPTGAEEISIGSASATVVYPNPTSSLLTIKSPVSINSIVVYNEAGVEMMATDCNGETTVVINLEDLATGHYFVKVNNNAPVKVIKN